MNITDSKRCIKCGASLQPDALYCHACGKKQVTERKRTKAGNGSGSVYRERGTWVAAVTIGWDERGDGAVRIRKKKYGFATKRDALAYLDKLRAPGRRDIETLRELFARWEPLYAPRIGAGTMAGYRSAFAHFERVADMRIDDIAASDLQACIDDCERGKRTKQLMRVVAGLICKFAIDEKEITVNPAANLWTGNEEQGHRKPLTAEEVARIRASGLPYADYIVVMSYMGYRPSELFGLAKDAVKEADGIRYIEGGAKTDAGKNRGVPIPSSIVPIIDHRLEVVGTELLFPRELRNRKGEFTGYAQMAPSYFRESIFKPLCEKLGIKDRLPYGARHTFGDGLRDADGSDTDKAAVIGHTDYTTTKTHYQTSDLQNRAQIMEQVAHKLDSAQAETAPTSAQEM